MNGGTSGPAAGGAGTADRDGEGKTPRTSQTSQTSQIHHISQASQPRQTSQTSQIRQTSQTRQAPQASQTLEVPPVPAGSGAGRHPQGEGARRSLARIMLLALAAFAVPLFGTPLALHGTGEAPAPGVRGITVLRAVLCVALCVPAGEAYGEWFVRRVPTGPVCRLPPSRVMPAAVLGFLAALGLASVVSTGNLIPYRLADVDLGGLHRTRDGVLALIEINAFLLAALWNGTRRAVPRVVVPAAVITAEALRAHPTTEPSPLLGSALTAIHLTCAVLWAGGLWQVLRTVRLWRRPTGPGPTAAAALLAGYARAAAALLSAVALTGLVSTVRRMPLDTLLDQSVTTAYGRTLLAKALLVAVAAALALTGRLRLTTARPRLWRPAWIRARTRPRAPRDPLTACSPARAELVVLGAVLVVSALLTALPVPIRW